LHNLRLCARGATPRFVALAAPASCAEVTNGHALRRVRATRRFDAQDSNRECRNPTTRTPRIAFGDGVPQHLRLCALGVAC
jgi:hypothetical protein